MQRPPREEEGRLYSQLPENRQRVPRMAGIIIVERHSERGPRTRSTRQHVGQRDDVADLPQRAHLRGEQFRRNRLDDLLAAPARADRVIAEDERSAPRRGSVQQPPPQQRRPRDDRNRTPGEASLQTDGHHATLLTSAVERRSCVDAAANTSAIRCRSAWHAGMLT